MLQLNLELELLVLRSMLRPYLPLPHNCTERKKKKKKSENLKIPSCTKNKGKLYSSWRLVARMLNLSALPLTHKGSEVINCLCNVYFVQVYPLLITHTPVSKSGTYWLLTGSDCPGGKSVSFKWLVHFTGTVNLHTGNLQVVGTLGEGEKNAHRNDRPH